MAWTKDFKKLGLFQMTYRDTDASKSMRSTTGPISFHFTSKRGIHIRMSKSSQRKGDSVGYPGELGPPCAWANTLTTKLKSKNPLQLTPARSGFMPA